MNNALYAILAGLMMAVSAFPLDLIIDREGNEILAKILLVSDKNISYEIDSLGNTYTRSIVPGKVFMIKYEDGRKVVFSKTAGLTQDSSPIKSRISIAVLINGGVFGLFNVDNIFTKARYTIGATPMVEYRLNKTFSLGVECMALLGQPETNDKLRLLINPNIRASARFIVTPKFLINPIIALGATIWPKSSGQPELDPTFLDSRTGWDARAALCFEYWLTERFALDLEVGYSASSSVSREVWITHDMMLVGLGPKIEF